MSIESTVHYTSETPDSKNASPIADAFEDAQVPTTGEMDIIVNGPEQSETAGETTLDDQEVAVPRVTLSERATRRVADISQDLSDAFSARAEAHAAASRQDAVFDTYAENVAFTKDREKSERREARGERIQDAKDTLRGIGRGARRAMLGARVAIGYTKAVVSETVSNVGDKVVNVADTVFDTYDSVASTVSETYGKAKDTVNAAKETVFTTTTTVENAINNTIDVAKEKVRVEAEGVLTELTTLAKTGLDAFEMTANDVAERFNNQKARMVGEYRQARDAVGNALLDRMNVVNEYFKQRKDAAEARKAARIEARNERKLARSTDRIAQSRVVNAEIQNRLEQRAESKEESANEREARRTLRQKRGRAALTAFRAAKGEFKDVYNAVK